MTLEPGWYGKIPSLGDFASRRLRAEFIAAWDAWLQGSMAASRALLGEPWLDCYLTSPIWRFVLMPGVLGPSDSSAWTGLLMASVDKVGRHFPLTLALELDPAHCPDAVANTLAAQTWFADLERVALSALDIEFSVDDLERELALLPFPMPPAPGADHGPAVDSLAHWWQDPLSAPLCLDLPSVGSLRDAVTATANRLLADLSGSKSLWWSEARDSGLTQLHCLAGLPPDDYFPMLLQGSSPLV